MSVYAYCSEEEANVNQLFLCYLYGMDKTTREEEQALAWIVRDKYSGDVKIGDLEEDRARFLQGEPLDYIIGWKPFCGIEVDLSLRPLIPREETEYWVTQCIAKLKDDLAVKKPYFHFLDLCSGSGCIATALLAAFPQANGVCADIDQRMLRQARITMERNHIQEDRYILIESDMWSDITSRYDLICANPPYVGRGEEVEKSVREYEPPNAVFAGDSGSAELVKFFGGLTEHLSEDGSAYCEIGSGQGALARSLLAKYALPGEICVDQFGQERYTHIDATMLQKVL